MKLIGLLSDMDTSVTGLGTGDTFGLAGGDESPPICVRWGAAGFICQPADTT